MVVSDRLPHAEELFLRFVDRWYPPAAKEGRVRSWTKQDLVPSPEFVGRSATDIGALATEAAGIELAQVNRMLEAARGDWPKYLNIALPVDIGWVEAFDAYYDEKRVIEVVESSVPNQIGNNYLVIACEFGAVLGHVLKQSLTRLEWVAGDPYWESALFDSQTSNLIPVFQWAMKKLSSDGIGDGFAAKVRACLDVLRGDAGR